MNMKMNATSFTWRVLVAIVLSVVFTGSAQAVPEPLAYVANRFSDTVSVINTSTDTVIATVPTGPRPVDLAATPDGTRVYVPGSSGIDVIDTATNSSSTANPFFTGFNVAITPDGRRAYLTSSSGGASIKVLDIHDTVPPSPTYHTQLAGFLTGTDALHLAIAPDGKRAYVTGPESGVVVVVDTDPASMTYNTVLDTITVLGAKNIAITPNGDQAYVSVTPDTLAVIDTASNAVTANIAVGFGPGALAITPQGTKAYVLCQSVVTVIDVATNTVADNIGSSIRHGRDLAVTTDGKKLYVTRGVDRTNNIGDVQVIDIDPASSTYHTILTTVSGLTDHSGSIVMSTNSSPVAVCQDIAVSADSSCQSPAFSIDGGSFDPDGDPITLAQDPQAVPKGDNGVTLTITDSHGHLDSCVATVTVIDDSPPSPGVVNALIEVIQSGPLTSVDVIALSGFDPIDNCDANPTIGVSDPGPYEPGDHMVTLSATDEDGNEASTVVTVRVLTAQDVSQKTIDEVEDLVTGGSVNQGLGNSLIQKLEAAIARLDQGNTGAGCGQLQAFVNQVNDLVATGELTVEEGETLIDLADDAITAADCES